MKRKGKFHPERQSEILGVVVLCLTTLLFLALITDEYSAQNPPNSPFDAPNMLGKPGAAVARTMAFFVGDAGHVIYAVLFIWGLMLFTHRPLDRLATRFLGLFLLIFASAGLLQTDLGQAGGGVLPGGLVGAFVSDRLFLPYFGLIGTNVVGVTFVTIGLLLATDFLFVHVLVLGKRFLMHLLRGSLALYAGLQQGFSSRRSRADEKRRHKDALRAAKADAKDARTEAREARREAKEARKQRKHVRANDAPAEAGKAEPALHLHEYTPAADSPPEAVEEAAPMAAAETGELPFDAVPEIEAGTSQDATEEEAPKAVAESLEPVASDEQLDLVPGEAEDTGDSPRFRLRRAKANDDVLEELPPDFKYPKRFTKPSLQMLDIPETRVIPNLDQQLRETSALLEETLQTFGIDARVTDVTRGPTITRFEIEPAPGIKVSRFLALADDIALALKAHRVRVEAPIPGKGRVGIEVPNQERDQVLIRELLESRTFSHGKGQLKLALGKDIAGHVKVADLATMPHLLVAGATGAGKTVCVKALLASLLFKHTPDELQFILIDPKMVELSTFNDIPHLITPVVTEAKKASTALAWLINEMEERYRLFAELRTRNIEVYNESVDNGEIEIESVDGAENQESLHVVRKLPYIVCVIDELADLMMLARAEVEDAIGRLAQLARAVGIHLIIATQRPSVDVLTGVIKANFPSRLSFQVSSRVDSRCILDEIGAERLIGMGDMLYLPPGHSKPQRMQGAFVSDAEMNALVAYLKTQAPPQYRDEIENYGQQKSALNDIAEEDDPLFDEAVQVVHETGQASISMVQRRLRVGYTRAARLIDMMELKGIVGPHTGSKAREILVNPPSHKEDVA